MASVLRSKLPRTALPFLYPPRPVNAVHRPFSSSRRHDAGNPRREVAAQRMEVQHFARADRKELQNQKALSRQAVPPNMFKERDFGLLPDTFIMPTGRNKPSLTQWPRARLNLEWARLQRRVKDYFYVLAGKWAIVKPRPKLRTGRVPRIAQALQSRMYTAFAEGDMIDLRETCLERLVGTFRSRIDQRSSADRWTWRLLRYRGRPRLVSHKIAAVPYGEGRGGGYIAIRQAVVRIRSEQSLAKAHAETAPRDVTEYLVLQDVAPPGETLKGDWRVWGTLEEDTELWKQYI